MALIAFLFKVSGDRVEAAQSLPSADVFALRPTTLADRFASTLLKAAPKGDETDAAGGKRARAAIAQRCPS